MNLVSCLSLGMALCPGFGLSMEAAESLAQINTPLGGLLVLLHDDDKPVTVANFKQYITSGRYENSFVQRWEPGFVIQGGGFVVTNRFAAQPAIVPLETDPAIKNEYSVGRVFSNTYGTIAMARVGGQVNSATSEWFFNLKDNAFLDSVDQGFTVFGRVLVGTNVLNRFNVTTIANGIYRLNLGGALTRLPVLSPAPTFSDLAYTAFSLPAWPQVQISLEPDGRRRLSWNSLSNFVNHLEFSPRLASPWQTLVSTNGTGARLSVLDSRPGVTQGLYRVRVE